MTDEFHVDPMTTQGADRREPHGRAPRHLLLAGRLVREVLRRTPAELVEDDLYAAAVTALVDADADFDPVHDAPYERYVTARIRERMYAELRSIDWSTYDPATAAARMAAARDRMDAALDAFGDRAQALAALNGDAPVEPVEPVEPVIEPVIDSPDLPYLRAALADLPPDPGETPVDVHVRRAEGLAVLRASLLARQEEETRALSGLDAAAAAVRASRMSLGSGRIDLDVAEHVVHDLHDLRGTADAADRTA